MPTPDEIRAAHNRRVEAITARVELSDHARRVALARALTTARADLKAARAAESKERESRWNAGLRKLWGTDDLIALGADRASTTISARDAADRVARIKNADQAAALLRQAEATGDEILARAIGNHANDHTGSLDGAGKWGGVLADFLAPRETATATYEQMCAMAAETTSAARIFGNRPIDPPADLRGLPDGQIRELAADPNIPDTI
ncbi:hypothetical protein [Embleya sp. NPDC059259]|uniref:hypothetical protein n=1 Tax=unclassified Embleya TaxID=2699296 RepID=UPI00368AB841